MGGPSGPSTVSSCARTRNGKQRWDEKRGSPPEAPLRRLATEGAGEMRPSGGRNVARPTPAPRMSGWRLQRPSRSTRDGYGQTRRLPRRAPSQQHRSCARCSSRRVRIMQGLWAPLGWPRRTGCYARTPMSSRVTGPGATATGGACQPPTASVIRGTQSWLTLDLELANTPPSAPHGSLPSTIRPWRTKIFTARAVPMQSQRVREQTPVWGSFCPRWRLSMARVFARQPDNWPHFSPQFRQQPHLSDGSRGGSGHWSKYGVDGGPPKNYHTVPEAHFQGRLTATHSSACASCGAVDRLPRSDVAMRRGSATTVQEPRHAGSDGCRAIQSTADLV